MGDRGTRLQCPWELLTSGTYTSFPHTKLARRDPASKLHLETADVGEECVLESPVLSSI